jgi:hypothetical protein
MQHRRGFAVLLVLAVASVTAAAQQPAAQAQNHIDLTRVRFVPSYRIVNSTVTAEPDNVVVIVQTNWHPQGVDFYKLDNYAFQYTTAESKTGSAPAIAAGSQDTLITGTKLQVWNCAKGGLINGTVSEGQSITGATIVAVLPKDVTSFTLSIKDLAFVSPLVQRDSWQDLVPERVKIPKRRK